MPSRESQKSKVNPRQVNEYVRQALAYAAERAESGYAEIVPTLAAQNLGLSSVEALAVLMVLEDAGALKHHYRIYCRPSDGVLADVESKKDVERLIYCKFCDKNHGEEDLNVELVFRIIPDGLNKLLSDRAVA
jgi:hypothetical protein